MSNTEINNAIKALKDAVNEALNSELEIIPFGCIHNINFDHVRSSKSGWVGVDIEFKGDIYPIMILRDTLRPLILKHIEIIKFYREKVPYMHKEFNAMLNKFEQFLFTVTNIESNRDYDNGVKDNE